MSSILNTAVSGINAMKVMIENTIDKINNTGDKKIEKHVFLENVAEGSKSNTAVKVKEIYDNYNDFITEEKRKTNSQVKNEQTKLEQLLKLEDLLCDKSNVFNQLIIDLYTQMQQDIVVDKQNIFNQDIKKKFINIISALKDFDKKLNFLEREIKKSVINNLKKVNFLIDKIHDSTIDIDYFPILKFPNRIDGFIDERDNLVDELNDLISVKVVKNNNSYKVYLNNGMCIIDDHKKQNLIPLTSISDAGYIDIGYIDNDTSEVKKIDDTVPGSVLGALLKFRREELTDAKNKIGQLTVNFTDSINAYHTLGYDMFGHLGQQVFNISHPETISNIKNQSSPTVSSKWISPNNAKDTDYIIYFKNNKWTITRLSDHTVVEPSIRQDDHNVFITFDGIEFNKQGNNAEGDIYMIKPYSKTLEKLELLIDQNTPFAFSSIDEINYNNRNNAITMNQLNKDVLIDNLETFDQAYQKFSKSIAYKCNTLEEELPFKTKMVEILHDKKISMSNNIDQDYQDLNYQQDCYLANVKVLEIAESIFNEIIDCYS